MTVFTAHLELAERLADEFIALPGMQAVVLGGSSSSGSGDAASDIDLYAFASQPVPLAARQAIAERLGGFSRADWDLNLWDPGDEWFDARTGIEVDLMLWQPRWLEEQLERVLVRHEASLGYSTCFWNTVRQARALRDPQGWFAGLQAEAQVAYPEPLRLAIIAKNHGVLRRVIPAYAHQIEKAVQRGDQVSANHRSAALLASYFDVLFALNRVLHPGEKRLVEFARRACPLLPADFTEDVQELLLTCGRADESLLRAVERLCNHLDELLLNQGFDPRTSRPV